jgi:hypothetical protein
MTSKASKQNQKRLMIMTKQIGLAASKEKMIVTKFSMTEMSTMKDGLMDYCQVLIETMSDKGDKFTAIATFSFMWDNTLNQDVKIEFKKEHECPYCKGHSDSTNPKVLCQACRQSFGHSTIEEL